MQKKKDFSLRKFLLKKAMEYGKPFGHREICDWKNEAGIIAGKWYLESNAERRFRQTEEEHRRLKEEGVDLDRMIGGMLVKLSEKPLTYLFRKAPASTPSSPQASLPETHEQPAQLFHMDDWGKAPEKDYSFTRTINKPTHV